MFFLHCEHKNDVTIIVKRLYRDMSCSTKFYNNRDVIVCSKCKIDFHRIQGVPKKYSV